MRASVNSRGMKIVDYVNQAISATVQELSSMMNVSDMTIRRDLAELEKKHLLERYHGGARKCTAASDSGNGPAFDSKTNAMTEEKKRIGEKASEFINDDDIVFINGGTTVLYCLAAIKKRRVIIVTNNAAAINYPCLDGIDIMMLGGSYHRRLQSFASEITVNNISCVYSNCTILGVNALDMEKGMTTSIYQECNINEAMIQHTRGKVIVLADHTKMGRIANFVSAPLSKIDIVITDDKCPDEYVRIMRDKGINVILA